MLAPSHGYVTEIGTYCMGCGIPKAGQGETAGRDVKYLRELDKMCAKGSGGKKPHFVTKASNAFGKQRA